VLRSLYDASNTTVCNARSIYPHAHSLTRASYRTIAHVFGRKNTMEMEMMTVEVREVGFMKAMLE